MSCAGACQEDRAFSRRGFGGSSDPSTPQFRSLRERNCCAQDDKPEGAIAKNEASVARSQPTCFQGEITLPPYIRRLPALFDRWPQKFSPEQNGIRAKEAPSGERVPRSGLPQSIFPVPFGRGQDR